MSDPNNLYNTIVASGVDIKQPLAVLCSHTAEDGTQQVTAMLGNLWPTVPEWIPRPERMKHLGAFVVSESEEEAFYVIGLEIADVPPVTVPDYGLMLAVPERVIHVGQGKVLMAQVESLLACLN